MTQETRLEIEVKTLIFRNPTNGWTVFSAYTLESNRLLTGVGSFPENIDVKQQYEVHGRWKKHSTYGEQFEVSVATPLQPKTENALIQYLASGAFAGVKKKTAERIVDTLGYNALSMIDENPTLLNTVPGIGPKTSQKILASWSQVRGTSRSFMYLQSKGISPLKAQKILKKYGANALDVITANPYRLIRDFTGIGFKTADQIALSLGIDKDSPLRIQNLILHALESAESRGHCFLTEDTLESEIKILSKDHPLDEIQLFRSSLNQLSANDDIIRLERSDGSKIVYRSYLYRVEKNIAEQLSELLKNQFSGTNPATEANQKRIQGWIEHYSSKSRVSLSADQKDAIQRASSSKVFIITGGPGVGKSTTVAALVRLLEAMGKSVTLAAPTGRAAQRVQELTQHDAKTIHRLLEWSPIEKSFKKNETERLTDQVCIIDESSMIDIFLMDHILKALPLKSQLILIGDVDQLPSIGPGKILHDLIESGSIPYKKLTEVFRQAAKSLIIKTAHEINQGKSVTFSNSDVSDCHFIEAKSSADILEKIQCLLVEDLPKAGYSAAKDVQIITPMNKGPIGSQQINQYVKGLLNPSRTGNQNSVIERGDKVIQTVNNYELSVFNGDIGFVTASHFEEQKTMVKFGSREVTYAGEHDGNLQLAYSITIHKSQGSEFRVVIIPMTMGHYIMLQRNLIYTALTRAKNLAIFIGSLDALRSGIGNTKSLQRQTRLSELLKNAT